MWIAKDSPEIHCPLNSATTFIVKCISIKCAFSEVKQNVLPGYFEKVVLSSQTQHELIWKKKPFLDISLSCGVTDSLDPVLNVLLISSIIF